MDPIIEKFLQPGMLVLAFAIYIVTFFIRRIVETSFPDIQKKADENDPNVTYKTTFARWWNSVLLYAVPVVVGIGSGFVNLTLVFGDLKTIPDRCFYGAVVGWFSSFLYKVFKKALVKKVGVSDSSSSSSGNVNSGPPDA